MLAFEEEFAVFSLELLLEAQLKMVARSAAVAARLAPRQVFS